jgi:hypothetical protein
LGEQPMRDETEDDTTDKDQPAVSPTVLAFRDALSSGRLKPRGSLSRGTLAVEIVAGGEAAWAIVRRHGRGGMAVRLAQAPGMELRCGRLKALAGGRSRIAMTSAMGRHEVEIRLDGEALPLLRITVTLTCTMPLLMPLVPRDFLPLGSNDDPLSAKGVVEAAQRGLNTGLLYVHIDEPAFGSVLYAQNFSALNRYFQATGTTPDGVVGGLWPELGYRPPTPPSGEPVLLPAGEPMVVSDALLVFREAAATDERQSARHFLQMLGVAYTALDLPSLDYRDWVWRADKTLHDLDTAPEATMRHYGHRYAHPYTASEVPDSMVQLTLLAAMRDYTRWRGEPAALEKDFAAGLDKFFDGDLGALRRYLPNVGKEGGGDKNADAVDSWYLYHPLMNLARLALAGDGKAKDLLLRSVDFGIKAARHFHYRWPIQYDIRDFLVITPVAPADGRGQTDVGGLYAWVMVQTYELTGEKRFLQEARAALDASQGMGFNLNYQANITAWGAAACVRLWRITRVERYREQAYVYLASFFHNSVMWESEIGHARDYRNFMGVTCLQDAPYMAIYECFDSFVAFEQLLGDSGAELDPAVRMLVSEYCRYALDRAWFFYPDALPPGALSGEIRNGHIDPALSFPLEDLYVDGQPAGQVGQEIYGAGAAFAFAARMFHKVEDAPFLLFCDHFIGECEPLGERAIGIRVDGGETCLARLSLVRKSGRPLPRARVITAGGDVVRPHHHAAERIDYHIPASGRVVLRWG